MVLKGTGRITNPLLHDQGERIGLGVMIGVIILQAGWITWMSREFWFCYDDITNLYHVSAKEGFERICSWEVLVKPKGAREVARHLWYMIHWNIYGTWYPGYILTNHFLHLLGGWQLWRVYKAWGVTRWHGAFGVLLCLSCDGALHSITLQTIFHHVLSRLLLWWGVLGALSWSRAPERQVWGPPRLVVALICSLFVNEQIIILLPLSLLLVLTQSEARFRQLENPLVLAKAFLPSALVSFCIGIFITLLSAKSGYATIDPSKLLNNVSSFLSYLGWWGVFVFCGCLMLAMIGRKTESQGNRDLRRFTPLIWVLLGMIPYLPNSPYFASYFSTVSFAGLGLGVGLILDNIHREWASKSSSREVALLLCIMIFWVQLQDYWRFFGLPEGARNKSIISQFIDLSGWKINFPSDSSIYIEKNKPQQSSFNFYIANPAVDYLGLGPIEGETEKGELFCFFFHDKIQLANVEPWPRYRELAKNNELLPGLLLWQDGQLSLPPGMTVEQVFGR